MKLGIMSFQGTVGELREQLELMRKLKEQGVHPVALENMTVFYFGGDRDEVIRDG